MKGAIGLRFAAWIIAITLVALPVVGVLQGWFASDRWPVRQLQVHATFRHVSAAELRAAVAPSLGAGFFAIDLDKVRDAVAALPWVARVEVSKHWPDALDITVTEIDPVARWGSDALLARDGRIFKVPDPGMVNGLPQFNAPDDRVADVMAFYRTALGRLRALQPARGRSGPVRTWKLEPGAFRPGARRRSATSSPTSVSRDSSRHCRS